MSSQQMSTLAVKLDFLVNTDINLCEVTLVERTLKNLTTIEDTLCLQLALSTEYIPTSIQLLVLCIDSLSLLVALCLEILFLLGEVFLLCCKVLLISLEISNICIQTSDSLIKFLNMDIL